MAASSLEDLSPNCAIHEIRFSCLDRQKSLPSGVCDWSLVEENSGDSNILQRRKRRGSSYKSNFDRKNVHYEHNGYMLLPSELQEDDGNVSLRNVHMEPKVRHISYAIQRNKRRGKWYNEDRIQVTVWRDTKPKEREMEQDSQDRDMESWYKVTVPCGKKYDKTKLLNSIQSHCIVPFTLTDFHYDKTWARFFVQGVSTASALKDVSYKICNEEGQKTPIFVTPSSAPYSVQNKFTAEQMEQLKLTMKKRYDVSQQALDLQKLCFDPDLVNHNIQMVLNRKHCMFATLQVIQRNFPELLSLNLCNNKLYRLDGLSDVVEKAPQVKILNLSKNQLKSASELNKVKGLKLEELWLEGNPLCSTFSDHSAYVSAIRDCFPTLLLLDGREFSPPIAINIDTPELIKPCKESYEGSESVKSLILQFLQEYYLIYDYGDRQDLLSAYHDEACFSLTIPFNPKDPDLRTLHEYFKHSRNIKKHKDSRVRRQLLKHKKHDIVDSLSVLPKTQHDFSCFLVDICFHTEMMLCFSVNGVFKEVEGKSQGCVRAFTRTFITSPGSSSSIYIMNDELILRNASPNEIHNAFSIPIPTVCSTSSSTLSEEQKEMVKAFSMQSRMKLEWSQKCLEDNEWNYTRAGQIFTTLQTEGKIPEEAFTKMP
ncbi:nuclear RNA export factor 2-like [Castor canadensis]|uniref:Tip-associated protein n=1 Tax=Castor canadensis TaxID=51338 RepID=A0A8B7TRV3_CASCN|nr:nuclear RNA export factor 2-like [Castor canadensis]